MNTAWLLAGLLLAAPAQVGLEWGKDGLTGIKLAGQTLAVTRGGGVPMTALTKPSDWGGPTATVVDAATGSITRSYKWGSCRVTLTPGPDRLDLLVELTNTTAGLIDGVYCSVLKFALPGGSSYQPVKWRDGVVALLNQEQLTSPQVGSSLEKTRSQPDEYQVLLRVEPGRSPHHAVVADKYFAVPGRPLAPGASDRYRLSLRFGAAGTPTAELLADSYAERRRLQPRTLNWPDRRPIGTLFLCNSNLHWPKNPRGWLQGKGQGNDITTEEGLVALGKAFMEYADRSVSLVKQQHGQGVIIWDLEGAEWWHPITYVGNPQLIGLVAPEMDRFSDEFCRRFTAAGLRVGVTIRPTEVFYNEKKVLTHRDVADPVELMATKIAYAKQRWGATLFYLDSNVYTGPGIPWVMPDMMLEELNRRFPDVLIIPEWENLGHYRFAAPYKSCNLGAIRSNGTAQAIWPEAFSVVAPNTALLENNYADYLAGRLAGDVLLFPAWYAAGENRMVGLVYREAEWVKHGPSADLSAADATSPDPERRYHAAALLGRQGAQAALSALLSDTDPLVQRAALVALAAQPSLTEPALLDKLLGMLANPRLEPLLKPLLAKALAPAGHAAVPQLVKLLDSKDDGTRRGSLDALALLKPDSPELASAAVAKLLPFVTSKDKREALKAMHALGKLGARPAFDALLAQLANKDEDLAQAAVRALGGLGDLRAVEPLVKAFSRGWATVVVYSIRNDLHQALQRLTGAILDEDNGEAAAGRWRKWVVEHKETLGG